jgi:hypothetical protein
MYRNNERRNKKPQKSGKQWRRPIAIKRVLTRATNSYNTARLAACNRPREKIIKDQDDCIKLGFSRNVCAMAHVIPEPSPNCRLPKTVALALDAGVEIERDRCLEEDG